MLSEGKACNATYGNMQPFMRRWAILRVAIEILLRGSDSLPQPSTQVSPETHINNRNTNINKTKIQQ